MAPRDCDVHLVLLLQTVVEQGLAARAQQLLANSSALEEAVLGQQQRLGLSESWDSSGTVDCGPDLCGVCGLFPCDSPVIQGRNGAGSPVCEFCSPPALGLRPQGPVGTGRLL